MALHIKEINGRQNTRALTSIRLKDDAAALNAGEEALSMLANMQFFGEFGFSDGIAIGRERDGEWEECTMPASLVFPKDNGQALLGLMRSHEEENFFACYLSPEFIPSLFFQTIGMTKVGVDRRDVLEKFSQFRG